MILDPDICYRAVASRDARFDGVFFVGVSTTKIYCRPVCTVRTPGRDRCTFYISAALAERAGFRPCLRCRPELAPGNARIDVINRQAAVIANRIEDGYLTERGVKELAKELEISDRHLRRIVEQEFGVSPIELAQTQRLLLAKRLLTDTNLSMTEIAFASGFSSLRRFNTLFKERYRMNPTNLRKTGRVKSQSEILRCEIAYRAPLDWPAVLDFLSRRAVNGVELVDTRSYLRTFSHKGHTGWLKAVNSRDTNRLMVDVSLSLAPVFSSVVARVKRLFDLSADAKTITRHLGELASAHPGLRVPGAFDGFEIAVRSILGQQISVKAASTLAGRFACKFGEPIETPYAGLSYIFPSPSRIASVDPNEIVSIGVTTSRAQTINALARAIVHGQINLEPGVGADQTVRTIHRDAIVVLARRFPSYGSGH
jgi:AraC family transcriptional regulator, regulatory protein of adaptative response / DNA-3-methyladenine glycosylase II